MLARIEDFFLNKFLGRVVARLAVGAATYLASGVLGVSVHIDPAELTALATAAGHFALDTVKTWRQKKEPEAK